MSGKLGPVDCAVAALAAKQHGVVASQQLRELGLSHDAIGLRLASGRLHRVHTGVYAVGHLAITQLGRWTAAVLACGPGALLSHRSAAELWAITDISQHRIDVSVPDRSGRRRPTLSVHRPRALRTDDRAKRHGVPVTSPARTLLDLAAVVGPRAVERAFHEADRLRLLEIRRLTELCERANGHRGLRRLRPLVGAYRPVPETRSILEHRFVRLCREYGLPAPAVNVPLCSYEVDCYWPDHRLVVELDGYDAHHTRLHFEQDRERDAILQAAGIRVIRITDRRITDDPAGVANTVLSLLSGGSRN